MFPAHDTRSASESTKASVRSGEWSGWIMILIASAEEGRRTKNKIVNERRRKTQQQKREK